MQRNPVNFESAIETLKEEKPSAEAMMRARNMIAKRRPLWVWLPRLGFIGITGVVCLTVALWPRPTLGAPWSVAVAQSANVPASHRIMRTAQGLAFMEVWQDRGKLSMTLRDPKTGRVMVEMRRNDKEYFDYINFYPTRKQVQNPNAIVSAIKGTNRHERKPQDVASFDLVKTLLSDKHVRVLEQRRMTTPEGDRTFYKLHSGIANYTAEVYAEPETGRIRKIVTIPAGDVAIIEYPDLIDPQVFSSNVALVPGTVTYDVDAEASRARQTILAGLGSKGGITLRLAAMDATGALWVFWTGAPPKGTLSKPFLVKGVKLGQAFGIPAFTESWRRAPVSRPAPGVGVRLGGMARSVLTTAPQRLDISIPTRKGYVEFRGVRYQRVHAIYDLREPLGISSPGPSVVIGGNL